jgi:hypothetical protein
MHNVVLVGHICGSACVYRRGRAVSRYATLNDFGVDDELNTPSYGYNQPDDDL